MPPEQITKLAADLFAQIVGGLHSTNFRPSVMAKEQIAKDAYDFALAFAAETTRRYPGAPASKL